LIAFFATAFLTTLLLMAFLATAFLATFLLTAFLATFLLTAFLATFRLTAFLATFFLAALLNVAMFLNLMVKYSEVYIIKMTRSDTSKEILMLEFGTKS
jgi:hypothetical protein